MIEWGLGWDACRRAAAQKVAALADDAEDALCVVEGLDVEWGLAEAYLGPGGEFEATLRPGAPELRHRATGTVSPLRWEDNTLKLATAAVEILLSGGTASPEEASPALIGLLRSASQPTGFQ